MKILIEKEYFMLVAKEQTRQIIADNNMPKSYVAYCKPRTLSDKHREWARQKMSKLNSSDN